MKYFLKILFLIKNIHMLWIDVKQSPQRITNLQNCECLLPSELGMERNSHKYEELGLKLKNSYFQNENPNMSNLHSYLDVSYFLINVFCFI